MTSYTRDQSFAILGEVRALSLRTTTSGTKPGRATRHSAWVLPMCASTRPSPFCPLRTSLDSGARSQRVAYRGAHRAEPERGKQVPFLRQPGVPRHRRCDGRDGRGLALKVVDDYPPRQNTNHQWVLAQDVRRIPAEMAPIHPRFQGDKRIEVDLAAQTLICYEGGQEAHRTLVASGLGGVLATPKGDHTVILKQASRHMSNVPYADMKPEDHPAPGDIFDLPGVPWNTFIDLAGTAIHGAYWHNDYGIPAQPRLLNVSADAARFVYRWTYPIGGYEDDFIQGSARVGTPVIVR